MTSHIHNQNKQFINQFRSALYDRNADMPLSQLQTLFAENCTIHLAHPLGDLNSQ